MEYKVGQILTSKEDVEVEKALSGEKVVIPARVATTIKAGSKLKEALN